MQKRKIGRRGEESTETLLLAAFYIVLAGTVGLSFMSYVKSIENNTAFEKSYLSKDISFVSSVIQFAPGDLEFEYNQRLIDLGKFIIDLRESTVSVGGTKNEYGVARSKYRYSTDTSLTRQDIELTSPYSVDFAKNGPNIFLGLKADGRQQLDCPRLRTPGSWSQAGVTIDPGSLAYRSDTGVVKSDGTTDEATLMLSIAKGIQSFRSGITLTRGETPVAIKDRKASQGILVSLHAVNGADSWDNPLIIRFAVDGKHPMESRKLACLIGNELYRKVDGFTSVRIYPVSLGFLKPSDPYQVLSGDVVGVWLELGNIDKGQIEEDKNYIADAVWTAIDKYYT